MSATLRLGARVVLVSGLVVASATPSASTAQAQDDDWSLSREGSHAPRAPRHPHGDRRPHGHGTPHAAPPMGAPSGAHTLIERYRAMVERDPSETFALTRWVALATERDGSTEPLASEMRGLADADAATVVPRLVLAHLARRAGHYDEARERYAQILAAHPEDPVAEAEIARSERDAGELEAARAAYELARSHVRGERAATLGAEELDVLVELGEVEAARALDVQLAGPHPSVEQRMALPRAWLAHERPQAAVEALLEVERAVAGDPRALVPVRIALARALLAAGDAPRALEALDRVLATARGGLRVEAYEIAYDAHRQTRTLDALAARLRGERDPDARALLARLEDERGHDEDAVAAYDLAIRARPRDGTLRARRAHVLLRMGRIDDAAEALAALFRAHPEQTDVLVEAATVLVDAGRPDDARALLADASRARPRDVALHRRLAEIFSRWGDDLAALEEARRVVALEPSDVSHHALVADLLLARGDRVGALAELRRMAPEGADAEAHARLGTALADHDLLDEARAELAEALRLAPDDVATTQTLLEVFVRAGRDADAEPLAARLVTLTLGDPIRVREARASLVSIWARRRTLDRHVSELEAAFAATPPDRSAGALLAEALRRSGSLARADEVLVRLAELSPDDAETWTTLERIRTLRGDLAGAIDALDRAAAADPTRAPTYLGRMSDDALALYRDDDAVRFAERAIDLAPNDPRAHVRLGDLHRRRQRLHEAAASYRRALALDPDLHEVALALAEIVRAGGDAAAADALYGHVIETSADDDLVTHAIDASLEIELASGDATALLDRLLALTVAHYDRPVLARSSLAVLDAIATPMLPRAASDEAARADLERIAGRALGVLLRALASSDPSEQRTALAILSTARVAAAAPALLAAASARGDASFELDALRAAALVAGPAEAARLSELARGADPQRAALAIWALGRIGDVEALGARCGADSDVAALAALGLAHVGATEAIPALTRGLAVQSTQPRRAAFVLALAALGRAPTPSECAALDAAVGQPHAVALSTCDPLDAVARGLLGPPSEVGAAARAVLHDVSDLARAWPEPRAGELPVTLGLRAIDAAPSRDPSPALVQALAPVVRAALAGSSPLTVLRTLAPRGGHLALGLAGLPAPASTALFETTEDEVLAALPTGVGDPLVRAASARLLAALRPDDPRLVPLLADASSQVVRAALEGLAARSAPPATAAPTLALLLAGSDDWVARLSAARLLGRLAGGGEDALIAALRADSYAFVREAAADALGGRPGDEVTHALEAASTSDPEPRVRSTAAEALTRRVR